VAAACGGGSPTSTGSKRALRNTALHNDLGCGADKLPATGKEAQALQRAGRRRTVSAHAPAPTKEDAQSTGTLQPWSLSNDPWLTASPVQRILQPWSSSNDPWVNARLDKAAAPKTLLFFDAWVAWRRSHPNHQIAQGLQEDASTSADAASSAGSGEPETGPAVDVEDAGAMAELLDNNGKCTATDHAPEMPQQQLQLLQPAVEEHVEALCELTQPDEKFPEGEAAALQLADDLHSSYLARDAFSDWCAAYRWNVRMRQRLS